MKVGTRSWLWGAHHWWHHTRWVWRAWCWLYGRRPTWREGLAIAMHDIGYLGCEDIDGDQGVLHPARSASLVQALAGEAAADLVLRHSRSLCAAWRMTPSLLCWADKLAVAFELEQDCGGYLCRARATGELAEYRRRAAESGFLDLDAPDWAWARMLADHHRRLAILGAPGERLSPAARRFKLFLLTTARAMAHPLRRQTVRRLAAGAVGEV